MNIRALLLVSAALLSATAHPANAEDYEAPRLQIIALGGISAFRGGAVGSQLPTVIPFQPNTNSTTGGVIVSLRAMGRFRLELEAAASRGREESGFDTPNNRFLSAGLSYPVFKMGSGNITPLLLAGAGVTERRAQDSFQKIVEDAFEVNRQNPFGYAGVGIDWRATKTLGLRADYRYSRIFPDKTNKGLGERKSYGFHRVLGGLALSF